MKNNLKTLLLIFSLILFSSCNILDNNGSSISPLDTKIDFKVIESYDDFDSASIPNVFIDMVSEKTYGCFNYGILSDYKISDKAIDINIRGISVPDICLTALGPAHMRINLGELSGVYEIKVRGDGFNDNYNLLISDSLIILDGNETANTKPLVQFLYRYPQNSFAYLFGSTFSDSALGNEFIDTLKTVIDITEFQFADFAEIPYPLSSAGHYFDAKARYFYYKTEEDFNKIEEVMKSYKQAHFPNVDGISLSIINWMNRKFQSWLL